MCIALLHQINFVLGLIVSSLAYFLNIGARAQTSAERAPCFPAQLVMWFGHVVWTCGLDATVFDV